MESDWSGLNIPLCLTSDLHLITSAAPFTVYKPWDSKSYQYEIFQRYVA